MRLLLEQEIEVDRWEPLAVVCAEGAAELPEALAELGPQRVPGRFRWLPPG